MQKIMFNDKYELTNLVLSGKKTQTRRIVCQKLVDKYDELLENYEIASYNIGVACIIKSKEKFLLEHSPYRIGEEVAVAQSYQKAYPNTDFEMVDKWTFMTKSAGWKNKMFVKPELMPHAIKITNIRIERLQDISDEDCMREGIIEHIAEIMPNYPPYTQYCCGISEVYCDTPRQAFAALIDKISGKGTWESNPYVWAYDFELVK